MKAACIIQMQVCFNGTFFPDYITYFFLLLTINIVLNALHAQSYLVLTVALGSRYCQFSLLAAVLLYKVAANTEQWTLSPCSWGNTGLGSCEQHCHPLSNTYPYFMCVFCWKTPCLICMVNFSTLNSQHYNSCWNEAYLMCVSSS